MNICCGGITQNYVRSVHHGFQISVSNEIVNVHNVVVAEYYRVLIGVQKITGIHPDPALGIACGGSHPGGTGVGEEDYSVVSFS